jgi:Tol biopolymer transport system component
MAVDGTDLIQLTHSTTANTNPQWAPDGLRITYESQKFLDNGGWFYELCVISSDGTKTLALTGGVMPNWAPDNTNIAFNNGSDIFVIKPDGTGLRNLSNSSSDEFDFSWSPDSKFIAFVTNRDANAEIYTVCVDCEDNQQVNISNSSANDQHPSWSPDGAKIAFLSDDSVCVMNVDGSQKECFAVKALGTIDWKP